MEPSFHSIEWVFLGILVSIFLYALLTNAISKTILTLPIIFMVVGHVSSHPLGMLAEPEVLDVGKRLLAEVTLILVLFSDASRVQFKSLRMNFAVPLRMLIVGLPLTIGLGMIVALLLNPGAGFAMALLTAAVLTPTDAALGQTVLSSEDVPENLRQTINVESGLNDGLVLPFVLFGAILAATGIEGAQSHGLAFAATTQVVLGPLIGIALGWGFAKAMDVARSRGLMAEASGGVAFLTIAFSAYVTSELLGGNGFLAAFVAGMVFGNTYKHDIHFIGEFMEGVGQLLTMLAFLIFGALLLPLGLKHMTWNAVALAISFLTIVRMLPIWLSLTGSGLAAREKLFLGWFGPRGLASILFTLIMMDEFDFPGEEELLACVCMTVFLSIILHGISAAPLSKWIGSASQTPSKPIGESND
ncbi:potassium/proton antiporter (plasmid) [Phaeobacter gallaeciensis]|uniref:Potassium/proton antiporter n=1 Tax=Phaeobacter gallaeciensis TaxID=60890 RepID=A0AAC9ZE48_9RHOB|nr:cation:proton antiporter [Phaeobacter gallaeciensis]ATF04047.1 potassium/proton antiporter [Phaeobacter gallaeciensis]ATF08323.1 potassium/proton antiporter [Phaeobacter gallaeciensis]